jgi:hypothetical protein
MLMILCLIIKKIHLFIKLLYRKFIKYCKDQLKNYSQYK